MKIFIFAFHREILPSRSTKAAQMDRHPRKTSKELLKNANRLNNKLEVNLQQETNTIDKMVEFIEKEHREISNTRKAIAAEITTGRRANLLARIGDHYDSDSDQEGDDLCKVSLALKHSKHLFNTVLEKARGFCVSRSQVRSNGNANELERGNEPVNYALPIIAVTEDAIKLPADLSCQKELDVSEKVRRYIEKLESPITAPEIKSVFQEEGKREDNPKVNPDVATEVGSEVWPGVSSEATSEVRTEVRRNKMVTAFSGSGVKPQTAPNECTCKNTGQRGRVQNPRRLAINKMASNISNENKQETVNNFILSPRNSDSSEECLVRPLQERKSSLVQPTKIRRRRHSVLGIAINIPVISEPMLSKRRSRRVSATVEENSSTEIRLNYGQEKQRRDSARTQKILSRSQNFTEKTITSNSVEKTNAMRFLSDDTQFRNRGQIEGSDTPDINLSRRQNMPRNVTRRYSLPSISTLAGNSKSLVGDLSRKLQGSIVLEDVSSGDETLVNY